MSHFFWKIKIPLFLGQSVTSRQGNPPELMGNSKIVIERITLGGMLHLAEDNDWTPRGFKVTPRGCFSLSMVQAMSQEGITIFLRESKKSGHFH